MVGFSEKEIIELLKDDEQLEEFLGTLSGEDIKEYLTRINCKVRNISYEEGGIYEGKYMRANSLISPKRNIQEKYFNKMQELLVNVKGRKNKATIMYYLINELHLFEDGNGRTSRFIYEALSNPEFDINNNECFSHNENNKAKISDRKFENNKSLLRTEEAGGYASYFILEYLIDAGLVNNSEELRKCLRLQTYSNTDVTEYSGLYISDIASNNISVEEVALANRALLDNNELFSTSGLTMLIMLAKKGNTKRLEELSINGKMLPFAEGYRTTIWNDDKEDRDVSAKSMGDWTREDYLVAIEVADKLKESMLDTLIDMFERPESFKINEVLTVADKMANYNKSDFSIDPSELVAKDIFEMKKMNFEIDRETRAYKHIQELVEILEKNKVMPKTKNVQELGIETVKQQKDTISKDREEEQQIAMINKENTLDIEKE